MARLHAYTRAMTDNRKHVTIYTDGACKGNPGPGGYGVILKFGTHKKELVGGYRKTTNNRMELLACIEGLKALKFPCQVSLYSDSNYVVRAVEDGWIRGWMAKGWITTSKQPVKNKDLWMDLVSELHRHEVSMTWVKGHAGDTDNERCDILATEKATSPNLPVDDAFEQMLKEKESTPLFDATE